MSKTDGGLRAIFSSHLRDAHWQAIETWAIATGVPDAEYCFPGGKTGWVEYKQTATNKVKISPHQVGWLERRHRMGGRASLAVRKEDTLYLHDALAARHVLVGGLKWPPRVLLTGGPANWDWDEVRRFLTRG